MRQWNDHWSIQFLKECAVAGYEQSGINFAAYPDELVNKNKVAIRFECKEVGVI